ncbi:type II toxin-antitoxin system RelE/ParE family toxin [bacterium]|nr:MAG: type II toxin-antitoxin system RelE/ParE family toxin [bacterium]
MKLSWTSRAISDLNEIGRYIAADNPPAAKRFVSKLRQKAKEALDAPLSNRMVPELSREDVREALEGNYRIVYQITTDKLTVLTVFEGHKLLRP